MTARANKRKVYPRPRRRVFVGLSGGVDSAVSAALLQKEGYEVEGVFIRIALPGYPCMALADRQDALRVAAHLRIPFRDIDLSKEYKERVFAEAIAGYQRGETPNPDTLCNREIKFGLFYDYCMREGADMVATGHYARTKRAGERTHLLTGLDPDKDQSYFLWMVPEGRLANTLFPVGGLRKPQVRQLAKKFKLPNALRKDSQGLCFLGALSIEDMLRKELSPEPGDVLDEQGRVIGRHRGAVLYTIGERHGFTVNSRDASREPRYCIAKDIARNTITVSARPQDRPIRKGGRKLPQKNNRASGMIYHTASSAGEGRVSVHLREENWLGEVPSGAYKARYRYRQALLPATLARAAGGSTAQVKDAGALPPGQSLVLYDGQRCLGGGIIEPAP